LAQVLVPASVTVVQLAPVATSKQWRVAPVSTTYTFVPSSEIAMPERSTPAPSATAQRSEGESLAA
jgi:hypothetical protein